MPNMKTIHKFAVPLPPEVINLDLPAGSKILSLRFLQLEKSLFLWAEVPVGATLGTEQRQFRAFKTGDGIPASSTYIATAIDQYQPEAYHLYEMAV